MSIRTEELRTAYLRSGNVYAGSEKLGQIGQIYVDGALWRASLTDDAAADDAERVRERGARVRVEAVEGLTLRVRPLAEVVSDTEEGARS